MLVGASAGRLSVRALERERLAQPYETGRVPEWWVSQKDMAVGVLTPLPTSDYGRSARFALRVGHAGDIDLACEPAPGAPQS